MSQYNVYGLGNGIVDILLEISEEDFQKLSLDRGTMHLVEPKEQLALVERFHELQLTLSSGGSVANSVIGLSQLGGDGAFSCSLGDDRYGKHYLEEFQELKIEIGNHLAPGGHTGSCVVLITPDAERTMRTCLGVSAEFAVQHVNPEVISQSSWIFIEGYLFANPGAGHEAIQRAIQHAKESRCQVAITFSEAWVVESFSEPLREAVKQADLIFANEAEACAFAGTSDVERAFAELESTVPSALVTAGGGGVYVRHDGYTGHIPAFECSPTDLTGAGDMFAAGFLYGITHDAKPEVAARGGCYLASKVISQVGARLNGARCKQYWKECLEEVS